MSENDTEQKYCMGCYQKRNELDANEHCNECIEYFSDWTYEKPLCENVPEGYEVVDVPLKEKHFQRHNCGCEYCEYDEQEKNTRDMGLIIQEGEAYGKKIHWFGVRTKVEKCSFSGRVDPQNYSWDDYEGGIAHPVGIGSGYYLGHGCWTRYETDHDGKSPYGEHVIRQLKKKGTKCDLDKEMERFTRTGSERAREMMAMARGVVLKIEK